MAPTNDHLVGVWSLRDFSDAESPESDGPLGHAPRGYLIYTADGHVSVAMMRTDDKVGPKFMGYAGRWRVLGDRIIHTIEICSREDWVGQDQVRYAKIEDTYMTITANDAILLWHKHIEDGQDKR